MLGVSIYFVFLLCIFGCCFVCMSVWRFLFHSTESFRDILFPSTSFSLCFLMKLFAAVCVLNSTSNVLLCVVFVVLISVGLSSGVIIFLSSLLISSGVFVVVMFLMMTFLLVFVFVKCGNFDAGGVLILGFLECCGHMVVCFVIWCEFIQNTKS